MVTILVLFCCYECCLFPIESSELSIYEHNHKEIAYSTFIIFGPSFSSPTTFYGEAKSITCQKLGNNIFIFFSFNLLHCIFMRYNLNENYSFRIKLIIQNSQINLHVINFCEVMRIIKGNLINLVKSSLGGLKLYIKFTPQMMNVIFKL